MFYLDRLARVYAIKPNPFLDNAVIITQLIVTIKTNFSSTIPISGSFLLTREHTLGNL